MKHTDVKVTIDLLKPVGNVGFGYPLLVATGDKSVDYTVCHSLDDVVTAGFDNTTEMYKAANIIFMQNNAPSQIAVAMIQSEGENPILKYIQQVVDKEWRQLVGILPSSEMAQIKAICDYIETTNKMFFAMCTVGSTGDGDNGITLTNYDRTVFVHSITDDDYVYACAVVGATAGLEVGSFTYKNIILKGVKAQGIEYGLGVKKLSDLHKNGCFAVVEKAGDIVTSEGITGSGEYIDIIDCQDWIVQQIEYQTQKTLNLAKKIPYDNNGIAMLESVAINVLRTAYNMGMIADNEDGSPAYTVSYALKSECADGDIAARKYLGGKFAFTLAGAIHDVEIHGEISVA